MIRRRAAPPRRNGNPISIENTNWRARIPESRQTYFYGATLDFIPIRTTS